MKRLTLVLLLATMVEAALLSTAHARHYDARTGRCLSIDLGSHLFPSWSPYNYALANPLRNLDPDGQVVRAYTERLGSATMSRGANGPVDYLKRAAGWAYGPRHSFLRVTTDKVDVILELGGPQEGKATGSPLRAKLKGEPDARPGQEEHQVNRPQGSPENDYAGFEDKVLQIFGVITKNLPNYNGLDGPNSNGFIRFLVEAAGGGVNLPDKAWKNDEIKQYWEQYKKSLEEQKKKDGQKDQTTQN
jgi:RHS repeat-associated protein